KKKFSPLFLFAIHRILNVLPFFSHPLCQLLAYSLLGLHSFKVYPSFQYQSKQRASPMMVSKKVNNVSTQQTKARQQKTKNNPLHQTRGLIVDKDNPQANDSH